MVVKNAKGFDCNALKISQRYDLGGGGGGGTPGSYDQNGRNKEKHMA